jgi:hypothetical protein
MKKFTGDAPAAGAGAQRKGEAPAPRDEAEPAESDAETDAEADEAEAAPVDLKATVTLSGEALAALLEEVKHVRKTVPAVDAIGTPIPNTIPAATVPPADKSVDTAKSEGKSHKGEGKVSDPSSWWPQGFGQPAKR